MCNIEHMVGGEGQTSQSDGISYGGSYSSGGSRSYSSENYQR